MSELGIILFGYFNKSYMILWGIAFGFFAGYNYRKYFKRKEVKHELV